MKNILVIDNYDSFTYNLVHILRQMENTGVEVKRNDQLELEEVSDFKYIILSPGPGLPDSAGLLKDIIRTYGSSKKILGVCLGHQAIAEVFGGKLKQLEEVYHGVPSSVHLKAKSDGLFIDLTKTFEVGRYHSWIVDKTDLPDCLEVTIEDDEGVIMGLKHREYKVWGVQFHPESVLTPDGPKLLKNFLNQA
ncbi:anthranilate synthase component II [Xanthovirga aplysinae]|uniref:anthranilate synthase component II n=1 Tax=Xanthovirga aplysinae TaxID=2529853 RepID=UPI0012BB5832|nr:aminodeoxychorismate/anthranilate synthase component II [Xanthovirga aplysinae]MTI31951.1 aminodeoxychorismate/anthranilate synthase component II [Xanthovirga aplysinae]